VIKKQEQKVGFFWLIEVNQMSNMILGDGGWELKKNVDFFAVV
jgi:hypothetical protein